MPSGLTWDRRQSGSKRRQSPETWSSGTHRLKWRELLNGWAQRQEIMLVVSEMWVGYSWKESVYSNCEWIFGDRGWVRGNTRAFRWEKNPISKLPMEHMTKELMGKSARSKCQRNPHSHLHQYLMNFMQITLVYLMKACFFCSLTQAINIYESCPGHLTSILGQLSKDTQREGRWKIQFIYLWSCTASWELTVIIAMEFMLSLKGHQVECGLEIV